VVRRGDEVPPGGLGQRLQQGGREVLAQPGHLPVEPDVDDLVEHVDRDVHRDAVGLRTGLELVGHRQAQRALLPDLRVVLGADRTRVVADEQVLGERQQVGLLATRLLPPRVEVAHGHDVGRQPLVVELHQRLVVDEDVAPSRPVLQLGQPLDQGPVVVEEPVVGVPLTVDEGVADEQVP
jgi:hypothetical protein